MASTAPAGFTTSYTPLNSVQSEGLQQQKPQISTLNAISQSVLNKDYFIYCATMIHVIPTFTFWNWKHTEDLLVLKIMFTIVAVILLAVSFYQACGPTVGKALDAGFAAHQKQLNKPLLSDESNETVIQYPATSEMTESV